MSSKPTTTILVPSIGRLDYLPLTRKCIEAQTRRDFIVKILDNASDADAQRFFSEWARSDPRVSVVRVEPRIGMFPNFNRGLAAVDTPYVCFFHDDDVYEPRFVEVLADALDRHPDAAFSGSNYDFIDDCGGVLEERRWIKKTEHWPGRRYALELIGRGRNPVPMPGLMFRTSALNGAFDESLPIHWGDFVLLMRAAESGGMVACMEPVVRIRKHAGQASSVVFSKSIVMRTELLSKYVDEYAARHPDDERFVAQLHRRVAFTHRALILWGWMKSEDRGERDACLEVLGPLRADAVVRRLLRSVDRAGLRPPRVGSRLLRVARTAAEALRV